MGVGVGVGLGVGGLVDVIENSTIGLLWEKYIAIGSILCNAVLACVCGGGRGGGRGVIIGPVDPQ